MLPDTLSEVVAKTIAATLTCVEGYGPVKTEAETLAGVEAYTVLDTLNKVETEAPVNTLHQCLTYLP